MTPRVGPVLYAARTAHDLRSARQHYARLRHERGSDAPQGRAALPDRAELRMDKDKVGCARGFGIALGAVGAWLALSMLAHPAGAVDRAEAEASTRAESQLPSGLVPPQGAAGRVYQAFPPPAAPWCLYKVDGQGRPPLQDAITTTTTVTAQRQGADDGVLRISPADRALVFAPDEAFAFPPYCAGGDSAPCPAGDFFKVDLQGRRPLQEVGPNAVTPTSHNNGAGFPSRLHFTQEYAMPVDSSQLSVASEAVGNRPGEAQDEVTGPAEEGGRFAYFPTPSGEPCAVDQPACPLPAWSAWVLEVAPDYDDAVGNYPAQLVVAIATASSLTGVSGDAIAAVLYKESQLGHYLQRGAVLKTVRGDAGRAIGVAQVHRKPWESYYSYNAREGFAKKRFDLDNLADNVLVCALILARHGWASGDVPAQYQAYAEYNGGPNPPPAAKRYANEVRALQLAIVRSGAAQ